MRNMNDEPLIIEDLRPKPKVKAPRFWILTVGLAGTMLLLLSRSFYLQSIQGGQFRTAAEGNRVALLPIPAPRGIIFDNYSVPLVENIASTDALLDPRLLPTVENESYLLERLPDLMSEVTPEDVRALLTTARKKQREVVIKKALTHDEVLAVQAARLDIPSVRLSSSLVRNYPFGEALAHVLGYASAVTLEEMDASSKLLPIDATGKTGLEKSYEDILQGESGFSYTEVDAAGRPQKDLGRREPIAGENIHLTLDTDFQKFVYDLFRTENERRQEAGEGELRGAAIAIDPRDGAIRSFVSWPAFDPNVFSQPARKQGAGTVFEAEGQPLFSRPADGMYPPGSTIKPFIALGALAEGIISEETSVLSSGGISVGIWNFPDWKAGGHGVTDVKKAIAESVNTFFYLAVGGDQTHTGVGVEKTTDYLAKLGWGKRTGVDLPSEASGFLPSKKWKEETKGEPWYIGDTYHLGIGQGDVLVTPLQLASATAALANGREKVRPHFAGEAAGQPDPLPFRSQDVAVVREGMRETILTGSGVRLNSLPIALAGKTGTAQVGGSEETHALFTSFGPYERPELVVTVLLERAGEGDKVAVPFAEQIWMWWIEHRMSQATDTL